MLTRLDLGREVGALKLNLEEGRAITCAENLAKKLGLEHRGYLGITSFFKEKKMLVLWRDFDYGYTIKLYVRE